MTVQSLEGQNHTASLSQRLCWWPHIHVLFCRHIFCLPRHYISFGWCICQSQHHHGLIWLVSSLVSTSLFLIWRTHYLICHTTTSCCQLPVPLFLAPPQWFVLSGAFVECSMATCPFWLAQFLLPTRQSSFDQAFVVGLTTLVWFSQHHCCMPRSHFSLSWHSCCIVAITPLIVQSY